MKLKIKANSIRVRLGEYEVRQVADDGVIVELNDFGLPSGLSSGSLRRTLAAVFAGFTCGLRFPAS